MSDALLDLLFGDADDDVSRLLAELHWLVLKHPLASRSAIAALAAEGRRFATTPEGQDWKARLAESELVRRGQLIWELGTWNLFEGSERVLPTQLVEAFSRATAREDLERMLARRLEPPGNSSGEQVEAEHETQ